jgi:hypothetical protein
MTRSIGARNLILNSKKLDFKADQIDQEMITEHKEDIEIKNIRREACLETDPKKKKLIKERLDNWKQAKNVIEKQWAQEQRKMSQIKELYPTAA